jgi:hypothetical protein
MMRDNLPPPGLSRWTARRKLAVVLAVADKRMTLEAALRAYALTREEFAEWRRLARHGVSGLRVTKLMKYRRK